MATAATKKAEEAPAVEAVEPAVKKPVVAGSSEAATIQAASVQPIVGAGPHDPFTNEDLNLMVTGQAPASRPRRKFPTKQ
ncbi:hypothetical protein [Mycolicibacterium palauense]|uniref:hypothetical protein n=1 Tax=Mycolicibacterium palauense TaxID=2034511 RepID=UPI0011452ABC|nr:hypothetical protein [Mycolicibacterium palauense]